MVIPPILIRTVPQVTEPVVEEWWSETVALHPDWECVTYRDPLPPDEWPITSRHWRRCTSGAQMAGLIRLEALWHRGGIYLDSDIQVLKPLDPLLATHLVAARQDSRTVPDAMIGSVRHHPAIAACIKWAIRLLPFGAAASGPHVTTMMFTEYPGITILPPESFFPYLWNEDIPPIDALRASPGVYGVHHWAGSWVQTHQRSRAFAGRLARMPIRIAIKAEVARTRTRER